MDANPVAVVEALIHINNQLHQHEVSLKCLILLCSFYGSGLCFLNISRAILLMSIFFS